MQRGDIGIATADDPRPGYLGLVGEVFSERERGRPNASLAAADAALIVAAINDYDRLLAVEAAARAMLDLPVVGTEGPAAQVNGGRCAAQAQTAAHGWVQCVKPPFHEDWHIWGDDNQVTPAKPFA